MKSALIVVFCCYSVVRVLAAAFALLVPASIQQNFHFQTLEYALNSCTTQLNIYAFFFVFENFIPSIAAAKLSSSLLSLEGLKCLKLYSNFFCALLLRL